MKLIEEKPYRSLGAAGARLWREILESYDLDDVASRECLLLACEALDRAEALAREIKRDGCVLRSETGRSIRDHPACKIELANRAAVVKWLTQLGLTRADVRRGAGRPTLSEREALYAD
jgi:hypothetical protein